MEVEGNVSSTEDSMEQSKNTRKHVDMVSDLQELWGVETTADIDQVKEMKNMINMIKRDEIKTKDEIQNNSTDTDVNLKRKREDLLEEESCKKCKSDRYYTQDMPVDSEIEKESLTCDRDYNKCPQPQVDAVGLNVNNNSSKPSPFIFKGENEVKEESVCLAQDNSEMVSAVVSNQNQENGCSKPSWDDKNIDSSNSKANNKGTLDSNKADNQISKERDCNGAEKDQANANDTDSNKMPSRAEIVAQFWEEKEANKKKPWGKKRVPRSVYERLELFDEAEDCLVVLKLMIRKDEGTVTFNFTYMSGLKEAVHQIMQYFRNKFL